MNKKRLFFDFLQKHNALKAYKKAYKECRGKTPDEYLPLAASFVWDCTHEGHVYWRSLDETWCAYFQSIKEKYHF